MFTGGNSEVLVPTFFLHTTHCLNVFDLAGSAASGRHCLLRLVAEYLKVLGAKGWQGLKKQVPQSVSIVCSPPIKALLYPFYSKVICIARGVKWWSFKVLSSNSSVQNSVNTD